MNAGPLDSPGSLVPYADAAEVIARTERWLERAVIGLNLCPFAKAVQSKHQVRFAVTGAATPEELLADLAQELTLLDGTDAEVIATTLLMHPQVMGDFLDYNEFLDVADAAVEALGLEGVLQVASFHPQYQFADSEPDDMANYSNRSPFPTLHLLREASVDKAVESFPDAEVIFGANVRNLRRLGKAGWDALLQDGNGPAS